MHTSLREQSSINSSGHTWDMVFSTISTRLRSTRACKSTVQVQVQLAETALCCECPSAYTSHEIHLLRQVCVQRFEVLLEPLKTAGIVLGLGFSLSQLSTCTWSVMILGPGTDKVGIWDEDAWSAGGLGGMTWRVAHNKPGPGWTPSGCFSHTRGRARMRDPAKHRG